MSFSGRSIFGGGTCLHFEEGDDVIYNDWIEARRTADMQAYHKLRAVHGIWASAQDRWVNHLNELTEEDSRLMEVQYLAWCWNSGIPYAPRAK